MDKIKDTRLGPNTIFKIIEPSDNDKIIILRSADGKVLLTIHKEFLHMYITELEGYNNNNL